MRPGYLNTEEASEILDRCPDTLYRWAKRGGPILPEKWNGSWWWKVDDVFQFIKKRIAPKKRKRRAEKRRVKSKSRARQREENAALYYTIRGKINC